MITTGKRMQKTLKISLITTAVLSVFLFQRLSIKKLNIQKNDPSVSQYMNRLVEFFEKDKIDQAENEFLNMLDLGVYPKEAFNILTFNGELN